MKPLQFPEIIIYLWNSLAISGQLFSQNPSYVRFQDHYQILEPDQRTFKDTVDTLTYNYESVYHSILDKMLESVYFPITRNDANQEMSTTFLLAASNNDQALSGNFGLSGHTDRFMNTIHQALQKFKTDFFSHLTFILTVCAILWVILVVLLWIVAILKNIIVHGFKSNQVCKLAKKE